MRSAATAERIAHSNPSAEDRVYRQVCSPYCHEECSHPQRLPPCLDAWKQPCSEIAAWCVGFGERVASLRYLEWGRHCCSEMFGGVVCG